MTCEYIKHEVKKMIQEQWLHVLYRVTIWKWLFDENGMPLLIAENVNLLIGEIFMMGKE